MTMKKIAPPRPTHTPKRPPSRGAIEARVALDRTLAILEAAALANESGTYVSDAATDLALVAFIAEGGAK